MKKLVIMTILAVGMFTSGARALDLSIKGNVSETLTGSNNYFVSTSPKGGTGQTLTAGTLDVLARTPTTNYLLNTYFSYYKFFGPGAADTSPTWGTPAHANFTIDHTDQLTRYNAAVAWNRVDVAITSFAQTGNATGRGSIDTYTASGGLVHDLSRIDSLTFGAQATKTTYTDPAAFPFIDVTTQVAWNRTLSSTTTLFNYISFDWFSEDDPAQSQRLFWKIGTGLNSALTPRLTLTANLAWGFVNSYQTGTPLTTITQIAPISVGNVFVPQVGSGNSWLGDISLTYQLLKTTTVSLGAAQVIAPLFNGQLQKSDSINLSLIHGINRLSTLAFTTRFSFVPATAAATAFAGSAFAGSTSSNSQFFSASVTYSYQLAREWRTFLSYTFNESKSDTGSPNGSYISFGLSRDFTLLGNPTAINVAQRERARQRARQDVGYVFPGFH